MSDGTEAAGFYRGGRSRNAANDYIALVNIDEMVPGANSTYGSKTYQFTANEVYIDDDGNRVTGNKVAWRSADDEVICTLWEAKSNGSLIRLSGARSPVPGPILSINLGIPPIKNINVHTVTDLTDPLILESFERIERDVAHQKTIDGVLEY